MNLKNVRVVLIETTHPGNIGATARAMKTMGLEDLFLVSPRGYPCAEATARAAGADDILAGAREVETLQQALTGCQLVLGTSARMRSLALAMMNPREAARQIAGETRQGRVALVFGTERTGMTNEQMMQCHGLVNIPSNPAYSSLNLAAAVQILSYEIRMESEFAVVPTPLVDEPLPATAELMEGFYIHLEQTLDDIGYLKRDNPGQLMPRLRRLYNRARPVLDELNILRGILTATQKANRK